MGGVGLGEVTEVVGILPCTCGVRGGDGKGRVEWGGVIAHSEHRFPAPSAKLCQI